MLEILKHLKKTVYESLCGNEPVYCGHGVMLSRNVEKKMVNTGQTATYVFVYQFL